MDETTKTRKTWSDFHFNILKGRGIDIGCGPDPVNKDVKTFDVDDGDANEITKYVNETFDYVYSSHCLEHMYNPEKTILEWWKLVRPGGHLFFLVPDEDLYEQGVFPSRFNPDHKCTFTISKAESWSPVSYNILDLLKSLPNGEIISVELCDHNYDRTKFVFGPALKQKKILILPFRLLYFVFRPLIPRFAKWIEKRATKLLVTDQTRNKKTLAQIQCIVKKKES